MRQGLVAQSPSRAPPREDDRRWILPPSERSWKLAGRAGTQSYHSLWVHKTSAAMLYRSSIVSSNCDLTGTTVARWRSTSLGDVGQHVGMRRRPR